MIVHFPPAVEELLDCKYEWCGRTGARGFKREDHRMEHYRMVHMKESEYPEMSKRSSEQRSVRKEHEHRSSPTTSTIHSLVDWNVDTPSQIKETKRKSTAGEESVPLSGNIQHSRQPAEPVALLETLQQPKIYDSPPDSETVGSKVSASSSGLEALDANHTDSMDLTFTTADDVGSWETESNDVEELYFSSIDFCLGDEHVHKKPKFDIFEDLGTCAEPGHRHQTETVLDRNDMIDSSRCSTNHKLAVIEFQVLATLSASGTGQYRASLKMQWDVLGFMEDQFRDSDVPNTALGSVVIISGSSKHSQATSCKEYIAQNWPAHGLEILDALQDALDSPTNTSQSEIVARTDGKDVHSDGASSGHAELEIDVTLKMLVLKIESITPDIIVDIVQQLAWMGAALRTSKDGQVQYCEAKLQGVKRAEGLEPAHFYVSFDMNSPGKDDRSCWFPLFTNPVIAHGFPTAPRNHNEVGLEIPLDMMAALGGARHAADFEGGLVLKGYSALLVPIRRHEDSVQWHLIRARDEERISYQEASLQCPNRVLLKDLNHEALVTTRAFLGWWREAEINLGTGDADYESIDWSKAKEVGPLPRLTGGTLGVSKIISASVNFQLGAKDGSFHHFQDGPFQKTIDRAENLPVVLYDQRDRRAWLVPAILVILHIIQLQNHLKPFIVGGNKVKISPLDASRQAHAAREVIAKNKSQKLFDCESKDETEYCFRDAVLDIWSILDRLMEREATQQATPGLAMHATWQSTLYGWEFRAVADGDRHFKQKAQTLEKTAGRWYDLVKDVDAVVLFASGLGDIIKPKSDLGGLCREWRSLPKDKDYLAVCVPILEMFYAKAGHRQDHQYLTSAKLQWYRGSSLFEKCADVASDCGGCDRLQQLHRDSYKWIGYGKPPGKLEVNGCVAFGQAHRSLKRSKIFAMRKKAVHTLPNISIQDDEFAKTISGTDDCILPASSAPLSPEPRGIDGHEIQKMRRPPSPPNVNDALLQEEATVIRKNRQMTHAQTPRFDIPENSERGKDPVPNFHHPAIYPTEHQSRLRQDTHSTENHSEYAHTMYGSEDEYAPEHARKALRHKARLENYRHCRGCSCSTCSFVELEYPNSIELCSNTNGRRRNSMNHERSREKREAASVKSQPLSYHSTHVFSLQKTSQSPNEGLLLGAPPQERR